MFISQILSAIRANFNVILSKIVSPDEELSAIGRRTDVNFEHCILVISGWENMFMFHLENNIAKHG